MRCPKCGNQDDKVLDSRAAQEGKIIRRRRECLSCGHRFTTFEEILPEELRVVKRDGRHEDFSRQKLYSGILAACQKRPVSSAQIEALINDIIDVLLRRDVRDISSEEIGKLVMDQLESLDAVAYVRFASVYKRFESVGEFRNAIEKLKGTPNEPSPDCNRPTP